MLLESAHHVLQVRATVFDDKLAMYLKHWRPGPRRHNERSD